ncbi:phosphotransferase [Catenulispora pinisilvae]|uniref:phosphotransferase n=1 Tax=Catenulispora pinisilvae TaxID=2705253 RepID=UPI001E3D1D6C|nr:phosphotransferase [Catenulispora pinisilvae]
MIGELIGSGRDADIYAVDDSWVLRRNRDGRSQSREAAVMAHLHAHGYPVPEVRPARDEAATDLVMRRVAGPTLMDAAQAGEVGTAEVGMILADLLTRLHAVPLPDGAAGEPGTAVLHLDLHPLNVIRTPEGPIVIDWVNTRQGPPGLDWTMSALILAEIALDGSELAAPAEKVLSVLLAHRPTSVVLDDGVVAAARAERAADANAASGDLDAAVALVIAHV